MKLPVLAADAPADDPWYAAGLTFTCTQCGNCCTGPPGYIWISREEIRRLAEHLGLAPAEVVQRYCRTVHGRISLKEKRGPGGFDCIFLVETDAEPASPGAVPVRRRSCSIYPVRPLQCRTWPFWPENLRDHAAWDRAGQRCHGMNHGPRRFSRERLESIRDATDWPADPPTSAPARNESHDPPSHGE